MAEQGQAKWLPAEPTPPKEPAPAPSHHQQVKNRESLERGLSPSRPSLTISWGQGARSKTEQSQAPTRKSAAPMVGKMPWLKGGSSSGGAARASKFGPPVTSGVGITPAVPPPKLVTEPVKLGAVEVDVKDTPLPPLPPPPQVPKTIPPPTKTGLDFSVPPPHLIPQPPLPLMSIPKIPRNPTPANQLNINEMLAAAQRHMQNSVNKKLSNIGLPPRNIMEPAPELAIPLPESIPMPDNIGLPAAAPPEPGPGYGYAPMPADIQPPPDYAPASTVPTYGAPDNYSPAKKRAIQRHHTMMNMDTGPDPAPPGEGPDPDELAMLGIDPEDSTV
jgi:hypothetical protein